MNLNTISFALVVKANKKGKKLVLCCVDLIEEDSMTPYDSFHDLPSYI